jgi:hypothetical protein
MLLNCHNRLSFTLVDDILFDLFIKVNNVLIKYLKAVLGKRMQDHKLQALGKVNFL